MGVMSVQVISSLPHKVHADTIVYGPKYSFAVFDREAIESHDFYLMLKRLAQILFFIIRLRVPRRIRCFLKKAL